MSELGLWRLPLKPIVTAVFRCFKAATRSVMARIAKWSLGSGAKSLGIESSCRPGDGSSSLARNTRNSCETSGLERIVQRLPKEPFGPVPNWLWRWCQTAIPGAVRISTAIAVAYGDKGDAAEQRPLLSQQCIDAASNYHDREIPLCFPVQC